MTEEEKKRFQEEQEKLKNEREKAIKQEKKETTKEVKEVKKSKPKDAISALKEIGLKEVSNKTFINLENLTHLLNKDFEKLHKTKALGFIQILEREFKVNLNSLREDYLSFLNGGRRVTPDKTVITKQVHASQSSKTKTKQTTKRVSKQNNKNNLKIGPYLLIGAALLAAYFILRGATEDHDKINISDLNISASSEAKDEQKSDLISESLNIKSQDSNKNEKDIEDDIDLNKVVKEMLNKEEANDTKDISTNQEENQIATAKQENNISQDTPKISDILPKNNSQTDNQEKTLDNGQNIALASIENGNKTADTAKKEVDKTVNKKEEPKLVQKQTKPVKKPQFSKDLHLIAVQKAWVGVIYLDDYTKKNYLVKSRLTLDPNRNQLILVGHSKIKMFNNGKEIAVHTRKKARFLYENGKLTEISKQEYYDKSAGVRW